MKKLIDLINEHTKVHVDDLAKFLGINRRKMNPKPKKPELIEMVKELCKDEKILMQFYKKFRREMALPGRVVCWFYDIDGSNWHKIKKYLKPLYKKTEYIKDFRHGLVEISYYDVLELMKFDVHYILDNYEQLKEENYKQGIIKAKVTRQYRKDNFFSFIKNARITWDKPISNQTLGLMIIDDMEHHGNRPEDSNLYFTVYIGKLKMQAYVKKEKITFQMVHHITEGDRNIFGDFLQYTYYAVKGFFGDRYNDNPKTLSFKLPKNRNEITCEYFNERFKNKLNAYCHKNKNNSKTFRILITKGLIRKKNK